MPYSQQLLDLFQQQAIVRPRDLAHHGIPVTTLRQLYLQGRIRRAGRGIYLLPDADLSEHHSLAEAAKRVPHGVICLLSALEFHKLGTQAPFEIWMAIDRKARRPQAGNIPLHIVRFSGAALTDGIDQQPIEGISVRIYNAAKTVADCFKYRNKIGLDVGLEALREGLRERRFTPDELWHYAQVCHVTRVMQPYLEALL